MKTLLRAAALAALALTAVPQAAGAVELLTNGGFEDIGGATPEGWGGLTYYAGSQMMLPGWTVDAGSVDITQTGSYWGPAYEGHNSLDINGWNPGTISQSFTTVLGQLYNVSFAFSRNVAGAPDPATATVSAGGQTFNVVAPNDGSFGNGYHMAWQTGAFSFTGSGGLATLALQATNGGNGGVFFDDVSVQSVGGVGIQSTGTPEPAVWVMMIGGFGLAGAMLRRKRALAV